MWDRWCRSTRTTSSLQVWGGVGNMGSTGHSCGGGGAGQQGLRRTAESEEGMLTQLLVHRGPSSLTSCVVVITCSPLSNAAPRQ